VRDQVSHPYEINGTIIVLYILIFTFPKNKERSQDGNVVCLTWHQYTETNFSNIL
jgi:hypothetical protein